MINNALFYRLKNDIDDDEDDVRYVKDLDIMIKKPIYIDVSEFPNNDHFIKYTTVIV